MTSSPLPPAGPNLTTGLLFEQTSGIFWAYFIAIIWSYFQLKIAYYFPNPQKKFPVENYKIKILNQSSKIFANKGIFTVIVLKCLKMPS
jgi:hypothetical protein